METFNSSMTTDAACGTKAEYALDDEPQLWPLKTTPFEHYMLVDDRPSHPMAFCIEVLLEGTLQRADLAAALQVALSRHPLLRAVISRRFGRLPEWIPAETWPHLEWIESETLPTLSIPPHLNITREAGLRVWALNVPRTPRLVFQFHHAAVDGVGALEFIGDLLAVYGQRTSPPEAESPELAPLNPNKLKTRGKYGSEGLSFREWFPGYLRYTWENLSLLPRPLARRSGETSRGTPEETSFPPYLTRILETNEVQGIKQAAARWGITCNELYTTIMLQTFHRWNSRQKRPRRGWSRICMPVSLRTPLQHGCPADNQLSYLLINLRNEQLEDFSATLKLVHGTSHHMIGSHDAATFVRNLVWIRRVPWLLKIMTRLPICFGTGVLANVGDVKRQFHGRFPLEKGRVRAGSVVMSGLLGAAPVRPTSGVATSVGVYCRRLLINMNYDRQHLKRTDAEEILDLFIEGLRKMIEPECPAPMA